MYPHISTMTEALEKIEDEEIKSFFSDAAGKNDSDWYNTFIISDLEEFQGEITDLQTLQALDAFLHRYQERTKIRKAKRKTAHFLRETPEEDFFVHSLPSGLVSLLQPAPDDHFFLPILSLATKDKHHLHLYGQEDTLFSFVDPIVQIWPTGLEFESKPLGTVQREYPVELIAFSREKAHSRNLTLDTTPHGGLRTALYSSPLPMTVREDDSFGKKGKRKGRNVPPDLFNDNLLTFGLRFKETQSIFRRAQFLTSHFEIKLDLKIWAQPYDLTGDFCSGYNMKVKMGTDGGFVFEVSEPEIFSQSRPYSY